MNSTLTVPGLAGVGTRPLAVDAGGTLTPSAGGGSPLTVVGSGTVSVPAFGSANVGPFACAAGSGLGVAIMVTTLDGGQTAGETPALSGGEVNWCWYNNADPAGSRTLRFSNTDGAAQSVDYVVFQVTP